jgi:hypothetical protein
MRNITNKSNFDQIAKRISTFKEHTSFHGNGKYKFD